MRRPIQYSVIVIALTGAQGLTTAAADIRIKSQKLEITSDFAVEFDDGNFAKQRLAVTPSAKIGLRKGIGLNISGQIEYANDEVGLGDTSSFSNLSEPIVDDRTLQASLSAFNLTVRKSKTRFTVGKQIVAWGALDGFRITDVVNPVDLRESIATENRPIRLSIWGARLKTSLGNTDLDVFYAPDPTTNQVANRSDTFSRSATRFLGGFQASEVTGIRVVREPRDSLTQDAVYAVRIGRQIGETDSHFTFVSGPVQDPILKIGSEPNGEQLVLLDHPRRDLFGVDFVRPIGSLVGRLEASYAPDHPFNDATSLGPSKIRRDRITLGAGVDWKAPGSFFINSQIVADHIVDAPNSLSRPDLDLISSVRASRMFDNDKMEFRAEWLNSYTDSDGLIRFDIFKDLGESYRVGVGTDIFYGNSEGIFGQFSDASRLRLQLKATF